MPDCGHMFYLARLLDICRIPRIRSQATRKFGRNGSLAPRNLGGSDASRGGVGRFRLRGRGGVRRQTYRTAGVAVAGSGRQFWPAEKESDYKSAVTTRDLLRYQLYRPSRLQRLPRLGDVYAASHLGPGWATANLVTDVRQLFDGELYDISADAREAAKLAYQGASAPALTTRAASDLDRRLLSEAASHRARLTAKRLKITAPPSRAQR